MRRSSPRSTAVSYHRSDEVLGVVILDAGKPSPEGDALLLDFAAAYRQEHQRDIVSVASSATLERAVRGCVAAGANKIMVVPYLLGSSRSMERDLMAVLAEVQLRMPGVRCATGESIPVASILAQHIENQVKVVEVKAVDVPERYWTPERELRPGGSTKSSRECSRPAPGSSSLGAQQQHQQQRMWAEAPASSSMNGSSINGSSSNGSSIGATDSSSRQAAVATAAAAAASATPNGAGASGAAEGQSVQLEQRLAHLEDQLQHITELLTECLVPAASQPAATVRPANGRLQQAGQLDFVQVAASGSLAARVDYSVQHAYQARQAFLRSIQAGEAAVNLAAAALHIAEEDDALVSHSTVQLPVASYQQRLQRLAADFAQQCLPEAEQRWAQQQQQQQQQQASGSDGGGGPGGGGGSCSEAVLEALQRYLYDQQGFRVAAYGRSNLPEGALVDHPGVWEKAGHAYLNEVLVSRCGIPAALAIVLADIVRRLLLLGAIDFAVRIDCRDLGRRPRAQVLPGLSRAQVVRGDGTVLNTCTSGSLVELLRFLKRCYWPFRWSAAGGSGSGGGFADAASVFLEGESDAAMQARGGGAGGEAPAISRTARHRLERGIWTSPGGGDIRRALAACERLVLLCGAQAPLERRDLAVLYMHVGRFREAKAELLEFVRSPPPSAAAAAAAGLPDVALPPVLSLSPTGAVVSAGGQSLAEQALTDRLLQLLSGVEPAKGALSLEAALQEPPPQQQDDGRRLPLTW
ncbi:expressed protein [Chlorella variabilis]|uniref:Expressed protein n=1 Tax=Chlorella variabilis TaxID=554065 RepID=E1ZRG6_CHLVA|nr:expressed protein [Chlorella variabilis]EFN51564.1 expressed protein [Chlorella variabilis]|eukprot:XP_005843666.1 expressed protein [Chlorella variabilis]